MRNRREGVQGPGAGVEAARKRKASRITPAGFFASRPGNRPVHWPGESGWMKKKGKPMPSAVEAAFQAHAGVNFQELDELMAKKNLSDEDRRKLEKVLAALAFEDAE